VNSRTPELVEAATPPPAEFITLTGGGTNPLPSGAPVATAVFGGGTRGAEPSSLNGQTVVYQGIVEVVVRAGQSVTVAGQSVTVMQVVV
jgi:hypothetical protein